MSYEGQVKNGVVVLPAGVELAEGSMVRVEPLTERAAAERPGRGVLCELAELAAEFAVNPELPTDLAAQHDHYLYGTPKRP